MDEGRKYCEHRQLTRPTPCDCGLTVYIQGSGGAGLRRREEFYCFDGQAGYGPNTAAMADTCGLERKHDDSVCECISCIHRCIAYCATTINVPAQTPHDLLVHSLLCLVYVLILPFLIVLLPFYLQQPHFPIPASPAPPSTSATNWCRCFSYSPSS